MPAIELMNTRIQIANNAFAPSAFYRLIRLSKEAAICINIVLLMSLMAFVSCATTTKEVKVTINLLPIRNTP